MNRTVKRLKRGDFVEEEIVVFDSGNVTEPGSQEAWRDLNVMLQTCLDSGLLRGKRDAPDRITVVHHETTGWRIEVSTTLEVPV